MRCDFCKFVSNCNEWKHAIVWNCPDFKDYDGTEIKEEEMN